MDQSYEPIIINNREVKGYDKTRDFRSKVPRKLEPKISKLVILMKPYTMIQKSISQRNPTPETYGSKLPKWLEVIVNLSMTWFL